MALVALPPELRSICRRLTSTKVEQLPSLLPILLKDVARCQELLSRPAEPKSSDSSPEASVLVHRLKTQITTLLKGRTSQSRFVGAALVKAVVETGGWECLQASEPWLRELISILQKKDPAASKDLCVVTVTKIYTLMHDYPTLVREIVTPTLPAFAAACLQILKPPVSSKVGKAPYNLVETIFEAISTLITLHPTTLRQVASKFRAEIRPFLAPTTSNDGLIPVTLQASSRRLAIRLHMTVAKGGESTEWTRHVEELVKVLHSTADQIFRAVQETWESTIGYKPRPVNLDGEPQGGHEELDQLPPWVGLQAGGERIIGLLAFIEEYLRCRTRVAVTIPLTALTDFTTRISSIKPPSPLPGKEKLDSGQMNSAIGREERDDLWAVFPDIQIAAMKMHITLLQRLNGNYIPLAQETLDQTLRMLQSAYRLPQARVAAFTLVKEILHLCGPTLPKIAVEGLSLLTKCCCRDLLGVAGYLPKPKPQSSSVSQNGQKTQTISQSADAFLAGRPQDDMMSVSLSAEHLGAAEALLTTLFSHLPQQHIPSSLRSQMLKTAILCQNRDAQVASILHPARHSSGRTPQVILPYLTRQFPHDDSVEILRFNFRPISTGLSGESLGLDDAMAMDEGGDTESNSKIDGFSFGQGFDNQFTDAFSAPAPSAQFSHVTPTRNFEPAQNPFLNQASDTKAQPAPELTSDETGSSTWAKSLKRKNEDATAEISLPKRIEIDTANASMSGAESGTLGGPDVTAVMSGNATTATTTTTHQAEAGQGSDNESSDDESVHLNMELDTEDDEDEDENASEK